MIGRHGQITTLIISDIHGNLEALEAVLACRGPEQEVVCLGDLVGYGPNPNEVVRLVRDLDPTACLLGNHDLAVLGAVPLELFNSDAARAARWTAGRLKPDLRDWLREHAPTQTLPGTHLAHASPKDPIWEYMEESWQGPENFESFSGPLCFVGHTHVPRVFEQTGTNSYTPVRLLGEGETVQLGDNVRMIVNPGSVGQPRDGDWRAAYGVWNPEAGTFTAHRTEYAVETTQQKILDAGLPRFLAQRLTLGR